MVSAANNKKELREQISTLPDFSKSEVLASDRAAIACSVESGRFAVGLRDNGIVKVKVLPADTFISVEVEQVGEASVSRKTGFAKFSTNSGPKEINLCVHFRDTEFPVLRVCLFVRVDETALGELSAMKMGRDWESKILAVAHTSTTRAVPLIQDDVKAISPPGVAAEVSALHRLLVEGVLSEEEFREAKLKAISR
ncbi:hypothetical protein D3872_19805 [Massilia cavernae]|uniref:Uncharacterized protein n=2 Tax=Massilia cavernae TaxID=2320864 RepID=A0A418XFX7_9BURK|nr:hypothetical protein D3872_19805 [Massilia cavernae]